MNHPPSLKRKLKKLPAGRVLGLSNTPKTKFFTKFSLFSKIIEGINEPLALIALEKTYFLVVMVKDASL